MATFADIIDFELKNIVNNNNLWKHSNNAHLKGVSAESIIRAFISKILPASFGVSQGWIINEKGEISDERDILIYDKDKAPALFFESMTGIVPAVALLYDIQIKSSLTPKTLKQAYKKFTTAHCNKALIAIKGNNLLKEYLKIDKNALVNPKIHLLSSENDRYYRFDKELVKYSKIFTHENFLKCIKSDLKIDIKNINVENLSINGHSYKDLMNKEIAILKWISHDMKIKNLPNLKGFITGLLNTLYKQAIVDYISNEDIPGKTLSCSIVDKDGNILFSKYDIDNGLKDLNIRTSLKMNKNGDIKLKII